MDGVLTKSYNCSEIVQKEGHEGVGTRDVLFVLNYLADCAYKIK
jgi:hypothetical protein